jgi:hypothetical protein
MKTDDLETVVQVLPKRAEDRPIREVSVRGGDYADIDPSNIVLPNASDLAFLENAQELDLQARRKLGDLV